MEPQLNKVKKNNYSHRNQIKIANGKIIAVQHLKASQHIIRIECPQIAEHSKPGNFIHIKCDQELAMRRPMSIMRASKREGWIEVLFKIVGKGTDLLAQKKVGTIASVLGPIGVPFKLSGYRKKPVLIGGGVGIPPMIYLAEHMKNKIGISPLVFMGSEISFPFTAKPSQIMSKLVPGNVLATMPLLENWKICSRLASNNGYAGCFEGFVTDLARFAINASTNPKDDIELFACGPTAMLQAVQSLANEFSLPCQISLEEHMACAVGGCAGCAVRINSPTGEAMKRVCVDGPVFEAKTVVFGEA